MWIWIVLAIVILISGILTLGSRPLKVSRKASFEGIDDDEVIRAYNKISQWPQFKAIRWMIVHELKNHHPEGILVDAGCGPGYLIATMTKSLPHLSIIGIDIAEEMVRKAAQNLSSLRSTAQTNFRQGDIQALPLETNSVDFLVSTLSLHHWSEPKQALKEIYRILKPEGQFLIFDLRRDGWRLFYWLIQFAQRFVIPSVMRKANEPVNSLLASYTTTELEALLHETPFLQWRVKPGLGWVFICGQKQ
jgi:ubiquinone/menaquinone biosynthesis C-methylase UbiE